MKWWFCEIVKIMFDKGPVAHSSTMVFSGLWFADLWAMKWNRWWPEHILIEKAIASTIIA